MLFFSRDALNLRSDNLLPASERRCTTQELKMRLSTSDGNCTYPPYS